MQPVLQGYLGLLQGEKLHLYSIKNGRKLQWSFIWRHGLMGTSFRDTKNM